MKVGFIFSLSVVSPFILKLLWLIMFLFLSEINAVTSENFLELQVYFALQPVVCFKTWHIATITCLH